MDTEAEALEPENPREPEEVTVTLKGSGLTLEREVDVETALEVMNVVLGGTSPSRTSGSKDIRKQGSTGVSVAEAITASQATTNPERIVAIGAWLHDERGLESFTTGQVKEQFQKAKHKAPANITRDLNQAVKAGWLAPSSDEDGQYYVTGNTGRSALNSHFPKK